MKKNHLYSLSDDTIKKIEICRAKFVPIKSKSAFIEEAVRCFYKEKVKNDGNLERHTRL